MPDEASNVVQLDKNIQYDLRHDTLRIERQYLHCVQVVLRSDFPGEMERPQAKTAFIGGAAMELDLRPEGNKTILRTAQGEKAISIIGSKTEPNRTLIGKKRNIIEIGEILSNHLAGKEALLTFLRSPPQEKDSLIVSYLDGIVHQIAQEANLLPPEPNFVEEMKMLQQREDFAYGKDYTNLYDPVIYAPQMREQRRSTMKSKWFVSSNPIAGVMKYQAQRKKDVNAVDSSENREATGEWYTDKEEAQAIVDKLNAEEQIKEAGKDVPQATQAQEEKKTTQELVKEASNAFNELMEKAHADGKAVWQMSSEDRSGLRAPVLVYKDKEGNDKSFYPPVANMLPAVQHQLEIGSKDPRWIPAKEAGANPDIAIRKGAKAVTFILFTKDQKPYTKKFFNMADVSGKGVPALSPAPELRRDVYLHDMIDYLARRTERGTFKDGNYFMMFMDAKEATNKSYQAKKEVYDFSNLDYETYMKARLEAQRRLDVILKTDIQTPIPEKDYEKAFIQLLAKEIRQQSTTNYVIRAARKALSELKWQESHVKAAIKAFAPQAAFDNLARSGKAPSNTLMIVAVKGIESQKTQEQAAAR